MLSNLCEKIAQDNFEKLCRNLYPGRGFVIGKNRANTLMFIIYWIMGRGAESRNRVLNFDGGRLFTEVADPNKPSGDPKLTIYNAIRKSDGFESVVSNGHQTDAVLDALERHDEHQHNTNLSIILREKTEERPKGWLYEPDAPNFTPRITGICSLGLYHPQVQIAVLRRSKWNDSCDLDYFECQNVEPGFGYCVTTYTSDGSPLPPFTGEPLLMPITDDGAWSTGEKYWHALNEANKVALAVKVIDCVSGKSSIQVWNKYPRVDR